jgi:hypothetical protein
MDIEENIDADLGGIGSKLTCKHGCARRLLTLVCLVV